jgi:putative Ca2+/H+ antiporter (TMEM165/GDT1 family)
MSHIILSPFLLFGASEMGDKTQFATVALVAEYHSAFLVTIGTTMGMMAADGLAVFLGDRLAHKVQMKWMRYASASLFFIFAGCALYREFH